MSWLDLPKYWKEQKKVGHIEKKYFKNEKNICFHKKCSPSSMFFKEIFLERFNQFSMLKNDFENKNFEMFKEVVHKLGKFDVDMI